MNEIITVEKEVIDRFKFRVWDKHEKSYWLQSTIEQNIHWLMNPEEYKDANYPPDYVKIEQCTGLKDKNGKLIYEGDILAAPYIDPIFMQPVNMEVNNDVAYVEYYKGCFVAHYPEKQRKYLYDYENRVEVVGNINENADLLGEKK